MLERNIPKKPKNVQNSLQFDEFLKIIAGVIDFEYKSWFFPRNYFVFWKVEPTVFKGRKSPGAFYSLSIIIVQLLL